MVQGERQRYICMNHPDGKEWIFDTAKPDPSCPKCKKFDWVFCYSGDKKPERKETNPVEKKKIVKKTVKKQATKTTGKKTQKKTTKKPVSKPTKNRGRPKKVEAKKKTEPKNRGRGRPKKVKK